MSATTATSAPTTVDDAEVERTPAPPPRPGRHLHAEAVTVRTRDGAILVDDVSFSAFPGELVAIVGASGAGKSTLLNAMAGNLAPSTGRALVDGTDAHLLDAAQRREVGFVPQDDVATDDLPLGRMLQYAARLRLPRGTGGDGVRTVTRQVLAQVELTDWADVPVKRLSGGQRRRASIAVELVTSPPACLLDEPTSGLDPATAETIVSELRTWADDGRTIVFVTHNANDLRWCDRIVALAPGGRLSFNGTPQEAMELAATNDVDEVHRALTAGRLVQDRVSPPTAGPASRPAGPDPGNQRLPSRIAQWAALTLRTLENVVRNRLTMAIMVGSPAMVIAMFAILFQPAAFDAADPSPTSTIMIAFWVAFGGFFFGLTYGLLQICPEVPLMRRERRGGVSPGLQVLAKLTALAPILIAIDVGMLAVLAWLDRLPALGTSAWLTVGITLALDAVAALALGLLASALVRTPAQASLALPMLCFPAVLFSGAVLAVPVMAPAGRAISAAMPDRWAFEAIGADLGLRGLFADDPSPLGPALLQEYGDTWTISHGRAWLTLGLFAASLSVAAWAALAARCRRDDHARS